MTKEEEAEVSKVDIAVFVFCITILIVGTLIGAILEPIQ